MPRPPALSGEQMTQVGAEYRDGASVRQLCGQYGVSKDAIHTALKQLSIPRRDLAASHVLAGLKHRHLTAEQDREIVLAYQGGLPCPTIAKRYGVPVGIIYASLVRNGVARRTAADAALLRPASTYKPKLLSDEQVQQAAIEYSNGKTCSELAVQLGVATGTVGIALKRAGFALRSPGKRSLVANPQAFSTPETSEEGSYFIGLLITDGNVSNRGSVSLTLTDPDGPMVERLRLYVRSDGHTTRCPGGRGYGHRCKPQTMFAFQHKQTTSDLQRYGIVPRKSKDAKAENGINENRHFWRDVVDGDGGFFIGHRAKGNPVVQFAVNGSARLMTQFAVYVRKIVPSWRGTVRPMRTIFRVALSGQTAIRVITDLYRGCTIALPRKWEVAEQIMERWTAQQNAIRTEAA